LLPLPSVLGLQWSPASSKGRLAAASFGGTCPACPGPSPPARQLSGSGPGSPGPCSSGPTQGPAILDGRRAVGRAGRGRLACEVAVAVAHAGVLVTHACVGGQRAQLRPAPRLARPATPSSPANSGASAFARAFACACAAGNGPPAGPYVLRCSPEATRRHGPGPRLAPALQPAQPAACCPRPDLAAVQQPAPGQPGASRASRHLAAPGCAADCSSLTQLQHPPTARPAAHLHLPARPPTCPPAPSRPPAHLPAVHPGASQLMSCPSGRIWPMGGSSPFSACLLVQGRFCGVVQSAPEKPAQGERG
jgi:hypothetical protein